MPSSDEQLETLLVRLAAGDRSVFARVFEALWPPVYRCCLTWLKDEADAADAAQEAMHKIFQRISDYDASRPARPWALAIAGWECRTLARKRVRRRETRDDAAFARASGDIEAELIRKNLTEAALAALGELSALDRETLLASFGDEAAPLGATWRKRRERALSRLRVTFRRLYGLD